jgi:hypothetical protein
VLQCPKLPYLRRGIAIPKELPWIKRDPNMSTTTRNEAEALSISGVTIPDTKLVREATELVRDTESPLLFNHSTRVYYFGSLAGRRGS